MSRVPALALEGDALAPFQEDWQKIPVGGSGLGFNPSTSLRRLFFVSVQGQESYRRTLGMRKHSCQRFKTPLLLFYVFDGDSCTIKRSTRKPFLPVRDMGENGIAGLIFSQLERKGWISPCLGQCQYRYENYACRQYDTAPELSLFGRNGSWTAVTLRESELSGERKGSRPTGDALGTGPPHCGKNKQDSGTGAQNSSQRAKSSTERSGQIVPLHSLQLTHLYPLQERCACSWNSFPGLQSLLEVRIWNQSFLSRVHGEAKHPDRDTHPKAILKMCRHVDPPNSLIQFEKTSGWISTGW